MKGSAVAKLFIELGESNEIPPSQEAALVLWTVMSRIRAFETEVARIAVSNEAEGYLHTYMGEEAVAAGVIPLLEANDWLTSTYRNHGHAIARGVPLAAIAGELFGRVTGVCGGKGGSMHVADQNLGMIGSMGIVAGGLPIAVGAAFASNYLNENRVAVSFFGDGAVHQGAWHESLEFAALFNCPVVFVCENNLYAETTAVDYHLLTENVSEMIGPYRMPTVQVDGMDVLAVRNAAHRAINHARGGGGPVFIEAMTYRYGGQYEGDTQTYKPPGEVEYWRSRDPLPTFRKAAIDTHLLTADQLQKIEETAIREVADAFEDAKSAPFPDLEVGMRDVYAEWSN